MPDPNGEFPIRRASRIQHRAYGITLAVLRGLALSTWRIFNYPTSWRRDFIRVHPIPEMATRFQTKGNTRWPSPPTPRTRRSLNLDWRRGPKERIHFRRD